MSKTILALLVLLASYCPEAHSQILKNYGIKLGVTSADQKYQYTLTEDIKTNRRIGFNIAAYAEWFDLSSFSLITQAEYAQRGMGLSYVVTDATGPQASGINTAYSRLDYISIPILVKFTFMTGTIAPYLMAGPRADFLMGYSSDGGLLNTVYDDFKKTTFGGSAGIGVRVEPVLSLSVLAEFRYNFDFADSYATDLLKVRNNAFDFWVGIAL